MELWAQLQDEEGRIKEVETVKDIIFKGVSVMANFYKHNFLRRAAGSDG